MKFLAVDLHYSPEKSRWADDSANKQLRSRRFILSRPRGRLDSKYVHSPFNYIEGINMPNTFLIA